MSDGFVPEFPIAPYEQDLEPEEFRAMIYGSENSQHVRWWRACINPAYNTRAGATDQRGKWLHEEQDVHQFRAAISSGRSIKRFMPQGEIQSGDMTIMVMPDEIDLGDHDWIVCLGKEPAPRIPGVAPNAPLYQQKEPLIRGSQVQELDGVVSANGSVITGEGTRFLRDFTPGSIIRAAGHSYRCVVVMSDTQMLVDSPPQPVWNGNPYSKATESLIWWPVFDIQDLRDQHRRYRPEVDFRLAADERSIDWLIPDAPAPDTPLAATYRNFARYQIIGDQGLVNPSIGGVPLPSTFTMRMVRPDPIAGG